MRHRMYIAVGAVIGVLFFNVGCGVVDENPRGKKPTGSVSPNAESRLAPGSTEKGLSSAITPRFLGGVILNGVQEKVIENQCSRVVPEFEGLWDLSLSDIERMGTQLVQIEEELRPLSRALNQYYAQFHGVIFNGKRAIYISAVTRAFIEGDAWQKRPFNVCDGGASAWGAVFEVERQKVVDFRVNGIG